MSRYCGIDWAEGHHDVAIVDQDGTLVSRKRIGDDPAGFTALTELLTAAGDTATDPIPVAIETPRGLMVAAIRATGRPVYAIRPMAVARHHERHTMARSKSDHADAMTLANTEIGDDRTRFADARALKAYAGTAPVTRASGRSISITFRWIKNDRLAAAGWVWGSSAAANSGPARDHYLRRRAHGDRHSAALRHLVNKMLGQLYHCLHKRAGIRPGESIRATRHTLLIRLGS